MSDRKLAKTVELMKAAGLDGLIVYSRGTSSILRPSYLHYVSGFRPAGRRNAAVISKTGNVVLLVEPEWDVLRAKKKSWIRDIRGTTDFCAGITAVLDRLEITGTIGIAGLAEMTGDVYAAVREHGRIHAAEGIIETMQLEKMPEEIARGRYAARISDEGFKAFLQHSKVGVTELELMAEVDYAMRMAGADDTFVLLGSRPDTQEMHAPTDRRLQSGDLVLGEITAVVDGQFSQLCRTVVLGKPPEILVEKYSMLVHAFQESIKELIPGRAAGEMSRTMNRIITEAGYGQFCHPPYMRARGHGFAVGSLAPGGAIDDDTKLPFHAGQFVVVHPNQYIPEIGYLACGEMVLVTQHGPERLVETDTKLYVNEA